VLHQEEVARARASRHVSEQQNAARAHLGHLCTSATVSVREKERQCNVNLLARGKRR
jgi:hypothetical protein